MTKFGSGYDLIGKRGGRTPASRVQKVTVVKKHRKKKTLQKVTFRPKNNKVLPDILKTKMPIPLWGTIVSGGSGAGTCFIAGNTIITSSGAGPLVAGNLSSTRFTATSPGAMYALGVTAATYPTGFPIIFAPTVGNACLYGKYVVTAVSYVIEFIPVASADDLHVCIYPEQFATTTTATTISSLNEAMALPFAKSMLASYIHTKRENTLKGTVSMAKYLGVTSQELLNDPAYSGIIDSSGITYPTQIVNFVIWQNNSRNVAQTNAIPFKMKFTYHIQFSKESGRLMPE